MDIVLNIVGGVCYSLDHLELNNNLYQTHVRCYIYVSVLFSLCITSSENWLLSGGSFAISNLIVTTMVTNHFKQVPGEYYIVVCTTIVCLSVSLYCVESYYRKIYLMYKNMMELKSKQSTILNSFPESLVIADMKSEQFTYYNDAFDSLFHVQERFS